MHEISNFFKYLHEILHEPFSFLMYFNIWLHSRNPVILEGARNLT